MSGGIYISYRPEDASSLAGRLYERLLGYFPQNTIFMDLDRVAHGEEFVRTIEEAIESSAILIAVIGKQWLISDLENLEDYVHLELTAAFKRNIRVIPVLVEEASMPRYDELPDDLKALAPLHALRIRDANFDADYRHLVSFLLVQRGLLLAEQGRVEEAERAYREAVQISPLHAYAHFIWAFCWQSRAARRRPK